MSAPLKVANVGVAHGIWGEDVAAEYLRRNGYEILARNVHPCCSDARLEIDIVARDRQNDILVFVEVKQHAAHTPYERRLRSVDKRKRRLLRRAFRAWLRGNRWHGAYRFDVIEIYGIPGSGLKPDIDHIARVGLFTDALRFVNWAE